MRAAVLSKANQVDIREFTEPSKTQDNEVCKS